MHALRFLGDFCASFRVKFRTEVGGVEGRVGYEGVGLGRVARGFKVVSWFFPSFFIFEANNEAMRGR